MTDREKVINGMECAIVGVKSDEDCKKCPYQPYRFGKCKYDVMSDALSLLKAQEPIPCGERIKAGDIVLDFCECGYCKNAIRKPWRYCPFCGQAVKWE